mgnify:CR=1 FL=1
MILNIGIAPEVVDMETLDDKRRRVKIITYSNCHCQHFFADLPGIFRGSREIWPSDSAEILTSDVAAQLFPHQQPQQQAQGGVDQQVAAVIEGGVDPGGDHGHAEKAVRHVFAPDRGAHDPCSHEAGKAAHNGADEKAVSVLVKQACKAEDGIGDYVVADNGLPAPGIGTVQQKLQQAQGGAAGQAGPDMGGFDGGFDGGAADAGATESTPEDDVIDGDFREV